METPPGIRRAWTGSRLVSLSEHHSSEGRLAARQLQLSSVEKESAQGRGWQSLHQVHQARAFQRGVDEPRRSEVSTPRRGVLKPNFRSPFYIRLPGRTDGTVMVS